MYVIVGVAIAIIVSILAGFYGLFRISALKCNKFKNATTVGGLVA